MNHSPINIEEYISTNISNPRELEILYRKDKTSFKKAFNAIYPSISHNKEALCWHERLNHTGQPIQFLSRSELIYILISVSIAGSIAKLPLWMNWNPDHFFPRNISFVFFEMLMIYFAWKENLTFKKLIFPISLFTVSAFYINLLPTSDTSDTLLLSCIHLPIFLWSVVGYVYTGNQFFNPRKRIHFLRLNGDIVVMCAVMLLASGLFTVITMGLFNLIGINLQQIFANYLVIWGLPAIPIIATILVRQYPQLVSNISPIIAKLFTPLVTITLFIFLISVVSTGKNPYNDREFLFILNVMLIGVMAIILFSFSEFSITSINRFQLIMLFILLSLAVINNTIALSAIVYRLSLYGLSPNRLAVIGSNILILIHLIFVGRKMFISIWRDGSIEDIENTIAQFLPIYTIWAAIVVFLFPLIFQMK